MKKLFLGAVLSLGILVSPAYAQAVLTNDQVQAILSLLTSFGADSAVIANVNSALTGTSSGTSSGGTSSSSAFCYNFNSNITFGSSVTEANALQEALVRDNISFSSKDGFTEEVAAAVVKFQAKYGIPQTGYVGPLTRSQLNTLYACPTAPASPVMQPTSAFSFTYPTAGTQLYAGNTYDITWTGSDVGVNSYTVRLRGGQPYGSIDMNLGTAIRSQTSNTSSFSWTVPASLATGNYQNYQIEFAGVESSAGHATATFGIGLLTPPASTGIDTSLSNTQIAELVNKMALNIVTPNLAYDINRDGRITGLDGLAYLKLPSISSVTTDTAGNIVITGDRLGTAPYIVSVGDRGVRYTSPSSGAITVPMGYFGVSANTAYDVKVSNSAGTSNVKSVSITTATPLTNRQTSDLVLKMSLGNVLKNGAGFKDLKYDISGPDLRPDGQITAADGLAYLERATGTVSGPSITSFTASQASVVSGGSATLTWSGSNFNSCGVSVTSGSAPGFALLSGTSVSTGALTQNTTFELRCAPLPGSTAEYAIQSLTVTVTALVTAIAPTCTISANPSAVAEGSTSLLSWTTTNATSASIENGIGVIVPSAALGTGTLSVSPGRTYIMTVSSAGGARSCSVTVSTLASASTNTTAQTTTTSSNTSTTPSATINSASLRATANTSTTVSGTTNVSTVYITYTNSTGGKVTSVAIPVTNGTWSINYPTGFSSGSYQIAVKANSATGTVLTSGYLVVTPPTTTTTTTTTTTSSASANTTSSATTATVSAACPAGATCPQFWTKAGSEAALCQYFTGTTQFAVMETKRIDDSCALTTNRCVSPTFYWMLGTWAVPENRADYLPASKSIEKVTCLASCTEAAGCVQKVATAATGANQLASALSAAEVASSASAPSVLAYTWNNNLQVGSPYFADVTALQMALVREGVYTGDVTGGFYSQTYAAVQAFQAKYGINTTGYVGPVTREKLNALY